MVVADGRKELRETYFPCAVKVAHPRVVVSDVKGKGWSPPVCGGSPPAAEPEAVRLEASASRQFNAALPPRRAWPYCWWGW